MKISQFVDYYFRHEMAIAGQLSKEAVKKIIEKIVDEYVKLRPNSPEEQNVYIMNAGSLVYLICKEAVDSGINITLLEVSEEIIKAFAKHSLDNK